MKSLAVAAALLAAPGAALGQDDDRVEDIVVEGRRIERMVREFSAAVVAPPPGHNLSRWHGGVCIGVANLEVESARYMADRISDVAATLGLRPMPEGCAPNVLVIWTDDGPGLAAGLAERRPRAFRPPYGGGAASRGALQRFTTSDHAVRWWHVSLPVTRDTGQVAVRLPGQDPPRITGEGLLRNPVRSDMRRAFVIVDVTRTGDATLAQITDYVAMVALAQIDPEGDFSSWPTILNLFDDVAVADGMTDWDQSWLTALYGAELNQRNPRAQASSVGRIMYHDVWRPQVRSEREQPEGD